MNSIYHIMIKKKIVLMLALAHVIRLSLLHEFSRSLDVMIETVSLSTSFISSRPFKVIKIL